MLSPSRLYAASRAALLHFALSLAVALGFAALVFGIWFPFPYREIAGGRSLFWLIVSVDVVCGPLLTLVLFSPTKPRAELLRDMTLVVLIQLSALGFGLYTLVFARPVALVFEVDRFRAVAMADLDENELVNAPDWLRSWSWSGPKVVEARRAQTGQEMLESIQKATAGIEAGQRPSRWQDYTLNKSNALARAKSVSDLAAKHPTQRALLDEAIARTAQLESSLRWLPLVSRHASDWSVLIDAKTAEPVGYVHLDGF